MDYRTTAGRLPPLDAPAPKVGGPSVHRDSRRHRQQGWQSSRFASTSQKETIKCALYVFDVFRCHAMVTSDKEAVFHDAIRNRIMICGDFPSSKGACEGWLSNNVASEDRASLDAGAFQILA